MEENIGAMVIEEIDQSRKPTEQAVTDQNPNVNTTESTEVSKVSHPLKELRMYQALGESVMWLNSRCLGTVPYICKIQPSDWRSTAQPIYVRGSTRVTTIFNMGSDGRSSLRAIFDKTFGGFDVPGGLPEEYEGGVTESEGIPFPQEDGLNKLVNFFQGKVPGTIKTAEQPSEYSTSNETESFIEIDDQGQKCIMKLGSKGQGAQSVQPFIELVLNPDQPLDRQIEFFSQVAQTLMEGMCVIGSGTHASLEANTSSLIQDEFKRVIEEKRKIAGILQPEVERIDLFFEEPESARDNIDAPRALRTTPFYKIEDLISKIDHVRDQEKQGREALTLLTTTGTNSYLLRCRINSQDLVIKLDKEIVPRSVLTKLVGPEKAASIHSPKEIDDSENGYSNFRTESLLKEAAALVIGHNFEPEYVPPLFCGWTYKGAVVGYSIPYLEGEKTSLDSVCLNLANLDGDYGNAIKRLRNCGVTVDDFFEAENGIIESVGGRRQLKLIDLHLAHDRLADRLPGELLPGEYIVGEVNGEFIRRKGGRGILHHFKPFDTFDRILNDIPSYSEGAGDEEIKILINDFLQRNLQAHSEARANPTKLTYRDIFEGRAVVSNKDIYARILELVGQK